MRYLLETCATVPAAVEALERLPFDLAHNLTMVDRDGRVATAYLAPERRPVITGASVATNHQHVADWPEYAAITRSHEREALIAALLDDPGVTAEAFGPRPRPRCWTPPDPVISARSIRPCFAPTTAWSTIAGRTRLARDVRRGRR